MLIILGLVGSVAVLLAVGSWLFVFLLRFDPLDFLDAELAPIERKGIPWGDDSVDNWMAAPHSTFGQTPVTEDGISSLADLISLS
jgi:hypothetical protein